MAEDQKSARPISDRTCEKDSYVIVELKQLGSAESWEATTWWRGKMPCLAVAEAGKLKADGLADLRCAFRQI